MNGRFLIRIALLKNVKISGYFFTPPHIWCLCDLSSLKGIGSMFFLPVPDLNGFTKIKKE